MREKEILLALVMVVLFSGSGSTQPSKPLRPNIIFIMADDMGYGDPNCYNKDSKIPTPNMDQLARLGMLFTDAHTASSVCTPSRYSVINGRYAWKSRLKKEVLWSGYDGPLIDNKEITIADICKQAGYTTAAVGKWHLGVHFLKKTGYDFVVPKDYHEGGLKGTRNVDFTTPTFGGPNDLGFDYFFGALGGQNIEPYAYMRNRYVVGDPVAWRKANTATVTGTSAAEVHEGWMVKEWNDTAITRTLTNEAGLFMETAVASGKPFFLYYTPVAPHRPCTPSSIGKGKSRAGDRGDMVYEFDWSVGQVMKKLKALHIEKNTIIIVTSDNGGTKTSDDGKDYGHKTCGDLKGYKAALYEGGHRVPFIMTWPAVIKPGTVCGALISNLDLMATVSDLLKMPMPKGKDSESFAPVIYNERSALHRRSLIHHTYSGQYAIRDGAWKLIPHRKIDGSWQYELYHLADDPNEKTDKSQDYPQIVSKLMTKQESLIFDF